MFSTCFGVELRLASIKSIAGSDDGVYILSAFEMNCLWAFFVDGSRNGNVPELFKKPSGQGLGEPGE